LIGDIQKLALLRLDGLGFGKLPVQVRQKGPESGGLLVEALRSDTEEHPPAVTFQESKDLISGLLGVLSAGFVFEQKVGHRRVQVFDGLMDPIGLGL
jgi:hypothetical protein